MKNFPCWAKGNLDRLFCFDSNYSKSRLYFQHTHTHTKERNEKEKCSAQAAAKQTEGYRKRSIQVLIHSLTHAVNMHQAPTLGPVFSLMLGKQRMLRSPQALKKRQTSSVHLCTVCCTFNNEVSEAEGGTRMRGIRGTFRSFCCLFCFCPILYPIPPRNNKA